MGISDMMSGLMLVFLFVAIGFMVKVQHDNDKMKDVAKTYKNTKVNLNEALYSEFEDELEDWEATITKENKVVFYSPKLLFEINKSEIADEFKTVLEEFFPRYIALLTSDEYKDDIYELRVEGHTSDIWGDLTSKKMIYLNNMKLSQSRAYEVLSYCYSLDDEIIKQNREWLEGYFRANGMAFSKLKDGENARRVEFAVQLKTEEKLYKILK